MNKAGLTLVLGTACLLGIAAPAHAQLRGLFDGVLNVAGQATTKVSGKLLGGDDPVDLEQERAKFVAAMEAQTAGMDASAKAKLLATWELVERGHLLKNAQAYKRANGPMIDWLEAARVTAGGVILDRAMFGNSGGLGSVLSGATMDGILSGATGAAPVTGRTAAPTLMPAGLGTTQSLLEAGKAGAERSLAGSVTGAVSGLTSKAMAQVGFGTAGAKFSMSDEIHPEKFFGKHPSKLSKRDLYRENGNMGWQRLEASGNAEAYGPVAGADLASAAIFNFDPKSEHIVAAFRILAAQPEQFNQVVDSVSKALGQAPRYASKGSVMRAVFEGGAFVTADAAKVTAGWSQMVIDTYRTATPVASGGMK